MMRAIDTLRDMNRRAAPGLPKSAPISNFRERWARHVLRAGGIDRRYYELCVLSELRDRLRAGDVWVVGSRSAAAAGTPWKTNASRKSRSPTADAGIVLAEHLVDIKLFRPRQRQADRCDVRSE